MLQVRAVIKTEAELADAFKGLLEKMFIFPPLTSHDISSPSLCLTKGKLCPTLWSPEELLNWEDIISEECDPSLGPGS